MKLLYQSLLFLIPILGYGQTECELNFPSNNFENAEYGLNQKIIANDFDVASDVTLNVEKILPTIVNNITDANIYFYEDNNGMPGTLITSFSNVVPVSQTQVSSNFSLPWYEVELELPASVSLEGGENGTKYWVGIITTMGTDGASANFWEIQTNVDYTEILHYSSDGGTTWTPSPSNFHGVFVVSGECSGVSESCELNFPGNNFQNAELGLNQKIIANDFDVPSDTTLNVKKIIPTIVNNITDANIYFYEDNNGMPGTLITSFSNVVPVSQTQVSSNFSLPWYEVELELPASVSLEGGENGTKYWVGIITTMGTDGASANFWEIQTNVDYTEILHYSSDGGTTWTPSPSNFHGVFSIEGDCGGEVIFPDTYCKVEVTSEVRPITLVSFNEISNSSSSDINEQAQEYFLETETNIEQGTDYEIIVKGNTNGNNTQYVTVFFDWNQNNILGEDGEIYQIGSITNSTGLDSENSIGTISVPAVIASGEVRMRVVFSDEDFTTDPCVEINNGQAEDYTVVVGEFEDDYCIVDVVIGVAPITKVTFSDINYTSPAGLNAPAHEFFLNTQGNIERGSQYEFTVEGNTNGVGTYYYTAFIDWNQNGILDDEDEIYEIGTITNSTGLDGQQAQYNITVPFDAELGNTRMRVMSWQLDYSEVACANIAFGQVEDYMLIITELQDTYCSGEITQETEPVTSVQFAGINNTSSDSLNTEEQEFFINQFGNVEPELSYIFKLKGNTNGNHTNYISVFIDWNQNGILDDDGEMYQLGTISNSSGTDGVELVGSIEVPQNAILGETRMRVIKSKENYPTDPCDSYERGQIEDYSINVFEYCETPIFNVIPITSIVFAGIDNQTSAATSSPANEYFLDIEGLVQTGEDYLFVAKGNTVGAFDGCFTVFIDWNQNGVLDDEGEVYEIGCVFASNGLDSQQVTETITVPEDAQIGTTRMRVIFHENYSATDPCSLVGGGYGYAQTEDYRLVVTDLIPVCEIECSEDVEVDAIYGGSSAVVNYEINYECNNSNDIELIMVSGLASGEQFPIGETTVTYEVVFGNSFVLDSCSFVVTVNEFSIPECEIECSEDIEVDVLQGESSVVVNYEINYECNNTEGGELVMTTGLTSGEEFPIGETIVAYEIVINGIVLDSCFFVVTVNETLDVGRVSNEVLTAYPNPVKDVLHISYTSVIDEISVYNIIGKKVYEGKPGQKECNINLSNLPVGVYVTKIMSEEKLLTLKIVKD